MNPNRTELCHGTKSTDLPSRDETWEVYKSPSAINGFSAIAYATSPHLHTITGNELGLLQVSTVYSGDIFALLP